VTPTIPRLDLVSVSGNNIGRKIYTWVDSAKSGYSAQPLALPQGVVMLACKLETLYVLVESNPAPAFTIRMACVGCANCDTIVNSTPLIFSAYER
jgi:hypothetical protein